MKIDIKKFSMGGDWQIGALMLLFVAGLGWNPANAADAVAMVTDQEGPVTLVKDGSRRDCEILSYLFPHTRLRLETGGRATLVYFGTAKEYSFTGPAEIEITATAPRTIAGKGAKGHNLRLAQLAGLQGTSARSYAQAGLTMRGGPIAEIAPTVLLREPIHTRLLTLRPTFRWRSVPGATEYRLVVVDEDNRIVLDTFVKGTQLSLLVKDRLRPGEVYEWRVDARMKSGEVYSGRGKFSVLNRTERAEIETNRPSKTASLSERVLFAILLERMGVTMEANRYWRQLATERPDDGGLRAMVAARKE